MAEAGPPGHVSGPAGEEPDSPADLGRGSWLQALKRAVKEFRDDNATDWAAALTYYSVLSVFPGLLVLVAVLGLLGQHPQTTDAMLDIVRDLGPSSTVDTLREPIESVTRSGAAPRPCSGSA